VNVTILCSLFTFSGAPVVAASFDCTKATSAIDRNICDVPSLSALDDALAVAYNKARQSALDPQRLLNEQQQWLQKRNTCGNDLGCLATSYRQRIAQLTYAGGSNQSSSATQLTPQQVTQEARRLIGQKNFSQAAQVLAPLANSNDRYALYLLGFVYEHAAPPVQDFAAAVTYYKKSADLGFLESQHALAVAYDIGKGVVVDQVYSTTLLKQLADKNYGKSMYALGLKYAQGRGVARDLDAAIVMLRGAVSQNVAGAEQALAQVQNAKLELQDQEIRRLSNEEAQRQQLAKKQEERRLKQQAELLEQQRVEQQRRAELAREEQRKREAERAERERLAGVEKARLARIEAEVHYGVFDKEYGQAPKSRGRITFTELGYFRSKQEAYSALEALVAANRSTPFEMQTVKDGSLWRIVLNNDVKHLNDKDYDEKVKLLLDNLASIQTNTGYKNARLVSYTESTIERIRKNTRALTQLTPNSNTQSVEFGLLSTIYSWGLGLILLGIVLAFVPAIIGYTRKHSHRHTILILCIFGSWTGLLWIAALVWSLWPESKENTSAGIQTNPTEPEHKVQIERQNLSDRSSQISEKIKYGFSGVSSHASVLAQSIANAIRVNSQIIRSKLSRSNQTNTAQDNKSLTTTSAPVRACWITLFIAWACMLIPIAGLGMVGAALASAAFFISIIVMLKGQVGIGVIQLVLTILVSPILHFVGLWIWLITLK
jgi:uncharacterized protein